MKKIVWGNEKDFAASIKELLIYKGFKIDSYYDDIGSDGGRDIEAHTFEYDLALNEYDIINWWIELKYRSKSSLGAGDIDDIRSKIVRAAAAKVDKFLLITNTQYTPEFKENISGCCRENHIKIRYWDITALEELFFNRNSKEEIDNFQTNLISDRIEDTKLIFNIIKSKRKTVFLLGGSAGVGKSALARYILSHMSNSEGYSGGIIDFQLQGGIGLQLKVLANNFKKHGLTSEFCFSSDLKISEDQRLALLFDHCCTNKTILIVDNLEKYLSIDRNIENPCINFLLQKFLNNNMNGSILLLLSRVPLNGLYSTERLFFSYELKGWDIDFVYDKYLPYLQYLNTRISNIESVEERKKLLRFMEGNPLALNIANCLCMSNDLESIVSCIEDKSNPAQNLIKLASKNLTDEEIDALNKFAQFNRPMSKQEITQYVCSEQVLKSLKIHMLVETVSGANEQYSMHPLITSQFDLQNDIEKRKEIVLEISSKIRENLVQENIESIYNHGLLRQVAEMFLSIDDVNHAAEIIIRIGTRALSIGDVVYLKNTLKRLYNSVDLSSLNRTRLKKVEGHIYDFENCYDLAEKTYKEMLQESIDLNDPWSRAAALNGLGTIERFSNNCEKAISLYTESLQIRIDNKFIIDESNSHHNLGAVYIMMRDYDKAIEHLEKAKGIREKQNDIFRVSATELYLGECYIHTQSYNKAEKLLKQCINKKKDVQDVVGYIWANLAMAKLIICEAENIFTEKKLQSNISMLEGIICECKQISHMKECVMAQIFMAISAMMLGCSPQNVIGMLVEAQDSKKYTLLSEYYNNLIEKLMNIALNETIIPDKNGTLVQIALQLKI